MLRALASSCEREPLEGKRRWTILQPLADGVRALRRAQPGRVEFQVVNTRSMDRLLPQPHRHRDGPIDRVARAPGGPTTFHHHHRLEIRPFTARSQADAGLKALRSHL